MKASSRIYALLIGIDNYHSSGLYKDLKGCVRDVNLVNAYLQSSLGLEKDHIFRLTSPLATDNAIAIAESAGSGHTLDPAPTYENIVQTFAKLTDSACPGDFVYVHYSGHGGRVATSYPELKADREPDEGLVPSDYAQTGRYLRDVEIATLLKRMSDKGLNVTVVLDSCHSGGATRGDCAIRGSEKVDSQQDFRESLVDTREGLVSNWRSLTGDRTAGWLPAAESCTVLAACRPTEYAFEYVVTGTERHGALTYWMIDTLNALGNQISYKTLHSRVSAKIQSRYPSQLPMLIGTGDRSFFGDNVAQGSYTAAVLAADPARKSVTISAGMAQGISAGTRFAIYPLNADTTGENQSQAILEITAVEATRSTGKLLSSAEGGIDAIADVELGAPVKMLSMPADLLRRVELYSEKQTGDQAHQLPAAVVHQQAAALAAVREALGGNGLVVESAEDERESHYQVSVGRSGAYEICAGMPLTSLSPPLMIDQPSAPAQVVKRLVHLAKYQAVQELDNPASSLEGALDCQLLNANRQPLPDAGLVTVKARDRLFLRIRNCGIQSLNVAVLNLEPTWAISQLAIRGIESPFYQLDRNQIVEVPLGFQLPPSGGPSKEIIKIFAACGAADFRNLLLPALDQEIKYRGALRKCVSNAFAQLLEVVGSDAKQQPTLTRAVIYDPDPNAEWITQQFSLWVNPS